MTIQPEDPSCVAAVALDMARQIEKREMKQISGEEYRAYLLTLYSECLDAALARRPSR